MPRVEVALALLLTSQLLLQRTCSAKLYFFFLTIFSSILLSIRSTMQGLSPLSSSWFFLLFPSLPFGVVISAGYLSLTSLVLFVDDALVCSAPEGLAALLHFLYGSICCFGPAFQFSTRASDVCFPVVALSFDEGLVVLCPGLGPVCFLPTFLADPSCIALLEASDVIVVDVKKRVAFHLITAVSFFIFWASAASSLSIPILFRKLILPNSPPRAALVISANGAPGMCFPNPGLYMHRQCPQVLLLAGDVHS